VSIGYLHRGVEKLGEAQTYGQFVPTLDRMDYIAAVLELPGLLRNDRETAGNSGSAARAIHSGHHDRTEPDHEPSLWLGTHALDIGAMTVFLYAFREREEILKIFENYCGARLTTHMFRIGGTQYEIYDGFQDQVRAFLRDFPKHVDEYETLLTENRIWIGRTRGVGVISAKDAVDIGLTGPSLRGSGLEWDLRKAKPYAIDSDFEFDIPTGETGDTYDRYMVRIEEMRQSARIVGQAVEKIPDGPIMAKLSKIIKPPVGDIYHSIEAPKGELGYYIVSDGSTQAYRARVRPPSFVNLQALRQMVRGHMVADVVAIIGTLDIVLGEIDSNELSDRLHSDSPYQDRSAPRDCAGICRDHYIGGTQGHRLDAGSAWPHARRTVGNPSNGGRSVKAPDQGRHRSCAGRSMDIHPCSRHLSHPGFHRPRCHTVWSDH
jgi:NADH-quinone oxidoreductase subunit D